MKRILSKVTFLTLLLLLSLSLIGCETENPITCDTGEKVVGGKCVTDVPVDTKTDFEKVNEAWNLLDLGDISAVTDKLILPDEI
ncbi:hypothetical protein OAO42_01650, partial [Candidatus Izimaplasma bacterium]|nr:hypothetical protein [Candidatus Izimaplasma bacterium]